MKKQVKCQTCDYIVDLEDDAYFHKSENRVWCMSCYIFSGLFS